MIPIKHEWRSEDEERAFVEAINKRLSAGKFVIDYKLFKPNGYALRGARKIVRVQVTNDKGESPYWTEFNFTKILTEIKDY